MQYVMPLSQCLLYFSDISQKLLFFIQMCSSCLSSQFCAISVTYVEQLVLFITCMSGVLSVKLIVILLLCLFCTFLIDINEEENCHQA